MNFHVKRLADLALKSRLPAIYGFREFPDAGGLVSYGANNAWTYWRVASYIDKIFKGAKPGDLPIEQPIKFELIINLKTAKALGIAIPNTLLPAARDCRAAGGKLIVSRSPERRASGPRLRLFTRSEVVYWQGRLPRHGRSREIDDQSGAPDMGA